MDQNLNTPIHSYYLSCSCPVVPIPCSGYRSRYLQTACCPYVEASWNVMAHAQKQYFVFRRNGRVHLNRQGRQFSRLLAAEVCAWAVVMLDSPCSEVVWRVLATHSIRQFPLHFPSRGPPCAITIQLECTHCSETNLLPIIHTKNNTGEQITGVECIDRPLCILLLHLSLL